MTIFVYFIVSKKENKSLLHNYLSTKVFETHGNYFLLPPLYLVNPTPTAQTPTLTGPQAAIPLEN
jgi:hypothetical protein